MLFVTFGPKPVRHRRFCVPGEASDAASGIWRLLTAMAIIAAVVGLLELAGASIVATSPDPSSHAIGEEFRK